MVGKIDHLGIIVADLDASISLWQKSLGLEVVHREIVEDQGVEVAKFSIGESAIELITPVRDGTGVAKFLEKKGEGIHHVCLAVDDLEAALKQSADAGLKLIDEKPRTGAGGDLVAFLHPRSTNGVLVELKLDETE